MKTSIRRLHYFLIGALIVCLIAVESESNLALGTPIPQTEANDEIDEMKLIESLEQLQMKLESAELDQRDAAEAELIKLGPMVLDYLEPSANASSDALSRIARIRSELEKIAIVKFTNASTVKLTGTYSIQRILEAISSQTGNRVSTDRVAEDVLEQEVRLDLDGVEFWTALYDVMNRAQLMIDPYAGEVGELKLIPSRVAIADDQLVLVDSASRIPRCSVGLFDFSVTRISATRDLIRPASSLNQLTVLVRWEPRLQPISIDMSYDSVKAIHELGDSLPLTRTEGVFHGPTSAEMSELEIFVPLKLVDRSVKKIKTLEAELTAVLPGRQETFRFKKIGRLDEGAQQRKAGAVVTFAGIKKNEDLFGVTVTLSFDESFNALESHRAWAYDNPMYLEDDTGKKIEPVTLEGIRQSNEAVTIRYYFLEDPQEYNLVYKTVAAIIKHNVKLKIEDIDFP